MKAFLVKVLMWTLKQVVSPDPRLVRVRELVVWANELRVRDQEVTGERKRHQVLNRLVEEFPDAKRRDLALMIEQVLQEV
jgi:hypothetical protein